MRRVVITGFGIVSPIGTGAEAFFAGLEAGKNGIAPISRFDASGLDVRCAGEVKDESALLLDEEERELARRDPKVGFALAAAAEALGMAGVEAFSANWLVLLGTSLETFFFRDFSLRNDAGDEALARHLATHPWRLPLDAALSRIRRRHGNPGQAAANCSACAAGAQSIGQAFHAVREGRFDLALAGGFDSMINPLGVGGFQLLGAPVPGESRDGAVLCRPFDASRRGLVLGEGAGLVVLEERERARAAGKTIHAEIAGFGGTLDAHGLSAPDPDGEGAARAM
ncbi:MAG: beta-ketoacyl-[acyl-carrier-protein] synthase II, partial [Candidatus Accumulibacter sp.]|nr:beta-ketoacyl-[acyl-carrier-protein] synthase II [Accumulibacter sp.]